MKKDKTENPYKRIKEGVLGFFEEKKEEFVEEFKEIRKTIGSLFEKEGYQEIINEEVKKNEETLSEVDINDNRLIKEECKKNEKLIIENGQFLKIKTVYGGAKITIKGTLGRIIISETKEVNKRNPIKLLVKNEEVKNEIEKLNPELSDHIEYEVKDKTKHIEWKEANEEKEEELSKNKTLEVNEGEEIRLKIASHGLKIILKGESSKIRIDNVDNLTFHEKIIITVLGAGSSKEAKKRIFLGKNVCKNHIKTKYGMDHENEMKSIIEEKPMEEIVTEVKINNEKKRIKRMVRALDIIIQESENIPQIKNLKEKEGYEEYYKIILEIKAILKIHKEKKDEEGEVNMGGKEFRKKGLTVLKLLKKKDNELYLACISFLKDDKF